MNRPLSSSIPTTPGVYLYKDATGRIIYVGKARNLRKRVLSYFRPDDQLTPKTRAMLSHAQSIETLNTNTEKEALLLESSLIKKHRPHYNIVLRDDKQYILFRLSEREDFPRLEITRKVRKRDGARYFGPFTSGQAAKETWKSLHRIFPLRRCSDRAMRNRIKPCLYHHINLCLAPCVGLVEKEEYAALTRRVSMLLSGKSRELIELLRSSMETAADALDFEKAAALRDQIRAIEKTVERQAVVLQNGGDMDVLGVATRPDGLALGMVFVREGAAIDRQTFFWPGLGLEEAEELLLSFLGQFYGPHSAVPPRIVLPWQPQATPYYVMAEQTELSPGLSPEACPDNTAEGRAISHCHALSSAQNVIPNVEPDNGPEVLPEDAPDALENPLGALELLLSDIRGAPVHISVPRNADEHSLVDMAKSNAREAARSRADIPLADRLAVVFHSALPVRRIECVDVSHTSGVATKVGVVVYEDGKAQKSDYRVWNIDGAGGDDYAALTMWAARRLEHGEPWPDLLLIDGGKGQLAAVYKVFLDGFGLDENAMPRIPFLLAGIAKARDERGHADRRAGNMADRIFCPGRSNPLALREGAAELLYLQSVRDAAHDFSIGRHRQARAKQAFSGELQRLPGVGPHIAKLLWEHFDSVQAMKSASKEDIAALPGIGAKRAATLWASLQGL